MRRPIRAVSLLLSLALALAALAAAPPAAAFAQQHAPLAGKVIAVDPGHGGNSGAPGLYGPGEDVNVLAISFYLRDLLQAAGATVVMTRTADSAPRLASDPSAGQLEARVAIANRAGAQLFVSVHNNSHPTGSHYRGLMTFYHEPQGTRALAATIQRALVRGLGWPDLGVHSRALYVLRHTRMPAVLAEIGFVTNPTEGRRLGQDATRRQAAEALFQGILDWFGVTWTGEAAPTTPVSNPPARPPAGGAPIVLGYWARWGDDPDPATSLDAALPVLDWVSPYWYTVQPDGTLKSRETGHAALVKKVQDAGKKVIVLVNNVKTSDDWIRNATTRARAVDAIVRMVESTGADGVNIDFEGMAADVRPILPEFMRVLAARLRPMGKLVTMALSPRLDDRVPPGDFAVAHDYAALAPHADYFLIMTYDQHGRWSSPGPVASTAWVEAVVRYTVDRIPAHKVLLGLAGYGYDWATPTRSSLTQSVTVAEAYRRAAAHGARVEWDAGAGSNTFRYTDSRGMVHTVWFESARANMAKVAIADRYGLAGVGLWSLGQEDRENLWAALTPWKAARAGGAGPGGGAGGAGGAGPGGGASPGTAAGSPVTLRDVAGHWSATPVSFLVRHGILQGYPDGTFRPDQTVTRAELAKILDGARLIPRGPAPAPQAQDLPASHWAYDVMARALAGGVVVRFDDNTVRPDQRLSRAEAVVMINRALRIAPRPDPGPPYLFRDIAGHWALGDILAGVLQGIIAGYPDGTFRPDREITRAEVAALLARYLAADPALARAY